jgi:hypothetical protein
MVPVMKLYIAYLDICVLGVGDGSGECHLGGWAEAEGAAILKKQID